MGDEKETTTRSHAQKAIDAAERGEDGVETPAVAQTQTKFVVAHPAFQAHPPPTSMAEVIERLALNPAVDVDKLERLFELQDKLTQRQAERQAAQLFNVAFAQMQIEMPDVGERGEIYNKAGTQVVATFGKFDDIMRVLRPILGKHGFSLSFKSEEVEDGKRLKTVGFLRHAGGHTESSEFIGAPDTSGFKNDTQALGSTKSYGRRYTTFDLVNLTTRGQDDDAQSAHIPEPPPGFEAWEHDMEASVGEGVAAFAQAWNDTAKPLQDYATKYRKTQWRALKQRAMDADQQQVADHEREPGEEG